MSPVVCVPLLRSCVGDLLAVLHPEAFLMRRVGGGDVTEQGDWFVRRVR